VIECGPGKVLAGLTKRIVRDVQGAALVDEASIQEAIALVKEGA
jgi:[acyl-carrier-protein] S-malonyltransferase